MRSSLRAMKDKIAPKLLQVTIAVCALGIGTMEYVLSRPAHSTGLGSALRGIIGDLPFKMSMFGFLGGVVPEFIHPFSFALITMAVYPRADQKTRGIICVFWLVVEVLFELGQAFGHQLFQFLTDTLPQAGVSRLLTNYFAAGTYDHLDIVAICLGTASAFILSELITRGGKHNETGILEKWETKRHETAPQQQVLEVGI